MNKREKAIARIEYCYEHNMLGVQAQYSFDGRFCPIGCLFDEQLLRAIKNNGDDGEYISDLCRDYPRLKKAIGLSVDEAQELQDTNDEFGVTRAMKYLKSLKAKK